MGVESQAASGAKKLVIASMSTLSTAARRRRVRSIRSGVVGLSDISFCPLLGNPLGGCTGLVDLVVVLHPHDQAVLTYLDGRKTDLNLTATGRAHAHRRVRGTRRPPRSPAT